MLNGERLTPESSVKIKNWGENVFAQACLSKPNLQIDYQVPVDKSVIDFRVTNLRANRSKFVEVTAHSFEEAAPAWWNRKMRQQKAMDDNGGGVILDIYNLKKIRRTNTNYI